MNRRGIAPLFDAYLEAYGLCLLQDVLPVLEFIHQNQVIHRDIKPDNLVRRQADGKVVLIKPYRNLVRVDKMRSVVTIPE